MLCWVWWSVQVKHVGSTKPNVPAPNPTYQHQTQRTGAGSTTYQHPFGLGTSFGLGTLRLALLRCVWLVRARGWCRWLPFKGTRLVSLAALRSERLWASVKDHFVALENTCYAKQGKAV